MTDRDHFAAAALTGLLASDNYTRTTTSADHAEVAYELADAMLRERCRGGGDCPLPDNAPNLDAAPAAIASVDSVAPQPTTRGDSDRTDKAAPRPSEGTGDTPKPINGCVSDRSKPINGPDPDSRVWETHTPPTHATPGEGRERRECAEPVAWATFYPNGSAASVYVGRKPPHAEPLYRHPTLTDAEREDLQMWLAECLRQCSTATEGANEELAERWQGRAKRAAAMIERLGGGR